MRARARVRWEDVLVERELVYPPQSDHRVRRCQPDRNPPHACKFWVRRTGPRLFVALSCLFQLDSEQNEPSASTWKKVESTNAKPLT